MHFNSNLFTLERGVDFNVLTQDEVNSIVAERKERYGE
jgi:hypothetical protein